tara:strand:+ start:1020 stop:1364 length:345 start_codon:yes stop_codon:yes gene_type:complete
MSINSRSKGKRGELEWRDFLKVRGYEARRGQQFAGGGESPDVISNVEGVHWEVKRVEAGNPYNWLRQASDDCATVDDRLIPIVAHKRNKQDWICVLRASDLVQLLKERARDNDT